MKYAFLFSFLIFFGWKWGRAKGFFPNLLWGLAFITMFGIVMIALGNDPAPEY